MDLLADLDWQQMFVPQTPLIEIVIRGTIVYLALYTMLRVVLKRQRGGVGVTDLLVLVLIADASQNAMADGYRSTSWRATCASRASTRWTRSSASCSRGTAG